MHISITLTAILIIVLVFAMVFYVNYKNYQLKGIERFEQRIPALEDRVTTYRRIKATNMGADMTLYGENVRAKSIKTNKLNISKLCNTSTNSCITSEEMKEGTNNLDNVNVRFTTMPQTLNSKLTTIDTNLTRRFNTTNTNIDRRIETVNRDVTNLANGVNSATTQINDLLQRVNRIDTGTLSNLDRSINGQLNAIGGEYGNLQNLFNQTKLNISTRIGTLEARFNQPPKELWILFNPHRVGRERSYDLHYSNYPNMTFAPNTTISWLGITGLRCNTNPLNPIKAAKSLYGIELVRPNGTRYKKGQLGTSNKFYIRINGGTNSGKICKIDLKNNVLIAVADPGPKRTEDHYFFFTQSHHPRWYYMQSLFNNVSVRHGYHFLRFDRNRPQQTPDDAFLWMIV